MRLVLVARISVRGIGIDVELIEVHDDVVKKVFVGSSQMAIQVRVRC